MGPQREEDRRRAWTAAGLAGATVVAIPLVAGSGVPTLDGANLKEMITTVRSHAAQVQQLRNMVSGLRDLRDSIGDGVDFGKAKKIVGKSEAWVGEAGSVLDSLPKAEDGEAETAPAPTTGNPGPVWWLQPRGTPRAYRAAWSPGSEAGGLVEVAAGSAGGGEAEAGVLTDRGGPMSDWDPEQSVDRPGFTSAKEAAGFALTELYHVREDGADVAAESERSRIEQIHRVRGKLQQSAALYAWSLASAAPQALRQREEERNQLVELMGESEDLRGDVMALSTAVVLGVAARTDALLIEAAGVELNAIAKLAEQPEVLTAEEQARLAGDDAPPPAGETGA